MTIECVFIAGSTPGKPDPLEVYAGVDRKAFIPIAGKPMIEYVVNAIAGASRIGRIVIVGLNPDDGLVFDSQIEYVPARGSMLVNIAAGVHYLLGMSPGIDRVLIAPADIPLLTTEHVDWFIDECLTTDHDFYWAIIEQSVMKKRFPSSKRTYARLREGRFCSGDLLMVNAATAHAFNSGLWNRAIEVRKRPWRLVRILGIIPLMRFVAGRLSISEVEQMGERILGIRCKAVVSPYAEHGMDVDKPFQLAIVRRELEPHAISCD